MIRTHKPSGHHWTNTSQFQQTEAYREINLAECRPPPSKHLTREPGTSPSATERATKRRRIEKLANDFLEGKPLFISSARPCPEALKSTVTWNKKTSNEPKFVFPHVERTEPDTEPREDTEDEADILWRASSFRHNPPLIARWDDYGPTCSSGDDDDDDDDGLYETYTEKAQASCGRIRQARHFQPDTRPSDEAIVQAAAIRRAASLRQCNPVLIKDGTQSEPRPTASRQSQPAGKAAPHDVRSETPALTETCRVEQWLARRASHAITREADEESLDELRLSRIETPTRQSRKLSESPGDSSRPSSIDAAPAEINMLANGESGAVQESVVPTFQDNTQSGVPRSQGTRISHHSTWTSLGGELAEVLSRHLSSLDGRSTGRTAASPPAPSRRSARPRPMGTNRTSPNFVTPRQAPLEPLSTSRQHIFDGPRVYTAQQSQREGTTPFMFRKLKTDSTHGPKQQDRVAHAAQSSPVRTSEDYTPVISGQEIDRCASEPAISVQTASALISGSEDIAEARGVSQLWAGTQFLLHQAQRDLFTSPEKQVPEEEPSSQNTEARKRATTTERPPKQSSQGPEPSTQQLLQAFEGFSTVKKPRSAYRGSPVPTPTAAGRKARTSNNRESALLSNDSTKSDVRKSSGLRFSTHSLETSSNVAERTPPPTDSTILPSRQVAHFTTSLASVVIRNEPMSSSRLSQTDDTLPTNPLATGRSDAPSPNFTSVPDMSTMQCAQRESSTMSQGQLDQTFDIVESMLHVPDAEFVFSQG